MEIEENALAADAADAQDTSDRYYMMLADPEWVATDEEPDPPLERIIGGRVIDTDGTLTAFVANPDYEPITPGSPTDPLDAVLHLIGRGEMTGNDLVPGLRHTVLGVALDADGDAIVAPAPDDVPSVLVTTAPLHRLRIDAAAWVEVPIEQLAAALPQEGVDVLLNPGARYSMRVVADAIRAAAAPAPVPVAEAGG